MFRESLRGPNANRRRCARTVHGPFGKGGHGPSPVSPIVSGKHRSSVQSWAEIKDTLYRRLAYNRFGRACV